MGLNRRNIYFMLFALSGFSGLIYESIWTHYLKLFLGHAAYAQTLVLAIFMGGMAIGSWICSKYSSRWKNLLLGYALTEGIIGLFALIFHNAFISTIDFSYTSILPQLGHPMAISAFKWSLSALIILPQSVLLGMTFPLMSGGILRLFPERPGRSIGFLYFTNSIGAAIGVLVSGFALIKLSGLPGTIKIAGLINILLALTVWFLIRKTRIKGESFEVHPVRNSSEASNPAGMTNRPHPAPEQQAILSKVGKTEATPKHSGSGNYRFFLLASLVTGTASFIYEIGWIRMLSLVLGSSTHAFELMLSAFIFGLAFGGLWVQRRIDQFSNPVRYLAHVQIIMGFLALSTLFLYGNTFEVMQWILKFLSKTEAGYIYFNLSSNAIAMGIMLPATFCAGMTLPLITFVLIREGYGERCIGAVYSANTVGAILGVFFAIHLGMPLLGLKGLLTLGASLDIALGLALFWYGAVGFKNYRKPALITTIGTCAVIGSLLFANLDPYKMASGVYRSGEILSRGQYKVIYYKDGKTATVSLTLDRHGVMGIRTNGKSDSAIMMEDGREASSDEPTMILSAVLPMAFHSQARTAAVIGLGTGLTSHIMLSNPFLKEVDTVEIEEGMVEAASHFRPHVERVFSDPRSRIYLDDAKTFFSTYNKKYDLIVSEPSNPWVSGVAGLFSEEFYRLIKGHMNEDGLLVQWVQLYEINVELVVSVLKAISANFSDFAVYAANNFDLLIIARKNGQLPDLDNNILNIPAIASSLKRIHVQGAQDIEIRKSGTKKLLGKFLDSFPIQANSDYFPVLDQNAERARFMRDAATVLTYFTHVPLPASEVLTREGLPQVTDVSPSPFLHRSQLAFTAMALRDYFLTGKFDPKYVVVPEDLRQKALRVRQLFYACDSVTNKLERLESLFDISVNMIPYLSPFELETFWKKLESGPCASKLTAEETHWVTLFKAVGNRDASRMAIAARTLLGTVHPSQLAAVRYLVASGMLGSLAQGDRVESSRLLSKYKETMFGDSQMDLLFRLLASESMAH
jgi:spermidine synthase/MFS family permease